MCQKCQCHKEKMTTDICVISVNVLRTRYIFVISVNGIRKRDAISLHCTQRIIGLRMCLQGDEYYLGTTQIERCNQMYFHFQFIAVIKLRILHKVYVLRRCESLIGIMLMEWIIRLNSKQQKPLKSDCSQFLTAVIQY